MAARTLWSINLKSISRRGREREREGGGMDAFLGPPEQTADKESTVRPDYLKN